MGTDRQTEGQTDGQTQVMTITLRPKRPRVKKIIIYTQIYICLKYLEIYENIKVTSIRQLATVILIRSSRPSIRCPRMPTRCPRMPSRWVRQSHNVSDSTHDWNRSMNRSHPQSRPSPQSFTVKLCCTSFSITADPFSIDFQDVSMMLPGIHEPTMPLSTIFQIVEIKTSRLAQCDQGPVSLTFFFASQRKFNGNFVSLSPRF